MKTLKRLLLSALVLAATALCAVAQPTNAPNQLIPVASPPPAIDPSLSSLLSLLGPHFAFLVPLCTWLFGVGVAMKLIAPKIQAWASAKVADNVTTPGSDHDKALQAVLSSRPYRWVSTALDLALSINLPTLSSYLKQLAAANPGVTIQHPDGTVSAAPVTTVVATELKTAPGQPAARVDLPGSAGAGPLKLSVLAALLVPAALLLAGCNGTLAPTGAYGSGSVFGTNSLGQPIVTNAVTDGMVLFQADQAIVNGETLIENFVMFAYKNQAQLAQWPQIQITANTLRAKAPAYINAVVAARNAYVQSPTSVTQSSLQSALAVLFAGISSAQSYQAQATSFIAQQAAAAATAQANAPPATNAPPAAPSPAPPASTNNVLLKTN